MSQRGSARPAHPYTPPHLPNAPVAAPGVPLPYQHLDNTIDNSVLQIANPKIGAPGRLAHAPDRLVPRHSHGRPSGNHDGHGHDGDLESAASDKDLDHLEKEEEAALEKNGITPCNMWVNIVKAYMGTGMLNIPWALDTGGFWGGLVSMVVLAILLNHTMKLLVRMKVAVEDDHRRGGGGRGFQAGFREIGVWCFGEVGIGYGGRARDVCGFQDDFIACPQFGEIVDFLGGGEIGC